ncbi:MAG: hypothetical protein S4CHLAM81_12850 [Chlamydiales bacterium]|nr:hypothetical protein [Chlamydiales bacterium]MCH9636060.1 hypothetical protein [Chlamydiales bacterium]
MRPHLLPLFIAVILTTKLTAMQYLPYAGSYSTTEINQRSFELGISETQLEDLRYSLRSLAYNSFSEILADRVNLQAAMLRVDKVHPLNFIMHVFIDQELVDCIHRMYSKNWLWRHFYVRVKRSLDEEVERDNVRPEYVQHFCDVLQIEFEATMEWIFHSNWDALLAHLFETFPANKE